MKSKSHQDNYALVEAAAMMNLFDEAMRIAQPLLNQNDPSTQWFVGYLHENGYVGEPEFGEAGEHFRRAALQGFDRANTGCRRLYKEGYRPSKSSAAGDKRFWKSVAEGGDEVKDAPEYTMPECSHDDRERALKPLRRAAWFQDGEAQIILGMMYEFGIHVARDREQALAMSGRAGGNLEYLDFEWPYDATGFYAEFPVCRDLGCGPSPSEVGLAEGRLLFAKLDAEMELDRFHRMYDEEREAHRNYVLRTSRKRLGPAPASKTKALRWYLKLAEEGDADAQWELFKAYSEANGAPRDNILAQKWLSIASASHPDADVRRVMEETEPAFWYGDDGFQCREEGKRMAAEWLAKRRPKRRGRSVRNHK